MRQSSCLSAALLGFLGLAAAQSSGDSVNVQWLEGTPSTLYGTTFGIPWARGKYLPNATDFSGLNADGDDVDLQTWINGYWSDGSIKWTGHAIGASDDVADEYTVVASKSTKSKRRVSSRASSMDVSESEGEVIVDTGKIVASFPKSGSVLVGSIETSEGSVVGSNGTLVLRSVSEISDDVAKTSVAETVFESNVEEVNVSQETSVRTLVTVRGKHQQISTDASETSHDAWLPFTVRFYLYADSEAIRIIHSFVYDGDSQSDFITGMGIRFDVPLADEELYNRHIRLAGPDGGMLSEAVQGITGLRRDPGEDVRKAQVAGQETPDISTWDTRVSSRMQWIPSWNDYSLSQLSPDGFTLKKRTKPGQSWIKIPGGTRSEGLAYLGGATKGGLAVGLRDFWKRYPTGLEINDAASDTGHLTLWLYSPSADPMDLRPFHDGMGEDTYEKQSDALEVTYEDYEPYYNTPYGIGRTNEIYLFAYPSTPSTSDLSSATTYLNTPPVLFASPEYMNSTSALGTYWLPPSSTASPAAAETIESHMSFLLSYYIGQIEQRRWYGFWDHGDFMHTADADRHVWRYDVGGYAWDNSELSPDLFMWNAFLRSGNASIYRFAEAQVRHTSEVDMYHAGNMTGLGTRHGVQHFGDSAKQVRVSNPSYRRVWYYISGGDERVGEVVEEVLDVANAILLVDPLRKVRDPDEDYTPKLDALLISTGLDWTGIASALLTEWERHGSRWEESRDKLVNSMKGIAALKNGFVTGEAYWNSFTGLFSPPPTDPDNEGYVDVSHLTAVFGLGEIVAQITDHVDGDLPEGFEQAWDDYCYYYGASDAEQEARYGESFGDVSLTQGHSRLAAFLAHKTGNASLATRAWDMFYEGDGTSDGLGPELAWSTTPLNGSAVLMPIDDATDWLSTNAMALYGIAGIENLALIGDWLYAPGEE